MTTRDIVIPYVHKKSKADELKYTIRSIEENFLDPFRIIIVGDLPPWANEKLEEHHIPTSLIEGIKYAHCHDVNQKIRQALSVEFIDESFIYTYDDIVFLSPVTFKDINSLKAVSRLESEHHIRQMSTGSLVWTNLLIHAFQFLATRDVPIFNYETHLPRVFRKSKLASLFADPSLDHQPFLFSTLYYNLFYKSKPKLIGFDSLDIKASVTHSHTPGELLDKCKDKLFLNYNNNGLNMALFEFLKNRFPNKNSFEK